MSTSCLSERLKMSMLMGNPDEDKGCLSERLQMSMRMANLHEYEGEEETAEASSLTVSYQKQIRPLLDAVDKLRNLDIMKEGVQLPTIVVVGDQSSGKSSVLESLAGIKLPRGEGICTRVPLVMRLQSCADKSQTKISIEYNDSKHVINEREITRSIDAATEAIAGEGKAISYTPITLHIIKAGAPDLTMVDLPGITRVPVGGQPGDIYEQISEIIMHYITPKQSIILNVLAANVDFSTCESILMSQKVDERGERTLAVVTKSDRAPEGLREKVTINAVNVGLGYVCVRNGINDETNAEARKQEKQLFKSHPQLKKIDKSMVGIPVLARKLMQIQAMSIKSALPDIVHTIDDLLGERQAELGSLPLRFSNPGDAAAAFMKLANEIKESLKKIIILGEFQQFAEEPEMHCAAWLREKFEKFYKDLSQRGTSMSAGGKFLFQETQMLKEAKGVGLPNFLPRCVFLELLLKMVEGISDKSLALASTVWDYLETVINGVIERHCRCYPLLESRVRGAIKGLVAEKKEECIRQVKQMIEIEKEIDFTLGPAYMETYASLVQSKGQFMQRLSNLVQQCENRDRNGEYTPGPGFNIDKKTVVVENFGEMEVGDIMEMPSDRVEEAYEMQMSIAAYWKVVTVRIGDGIPMYLQFVCRKLVGSELENQIQQDVGVPNFGAMDRILEVSPMVASRRKSLNNSLQLLKDSKTALSNIMDQIVDEA